MHISRRSIRFIILCILMCIPLVAVADTIDLSQGDIVITAPTAYQVNGKNYKLENPNEGFILTGSGNGIVMTGGAKNMTVVLENVSVASFNGAGIHLKAGADVTLLLRGKNTATGFEGWNGITIEKNARLTLTAEEKDGEWQGALTAKGGFNGAGIGAPKEVGMGEIVINGGIITSTGGDYGAGIGTGGNGTPVIGSLVINGGDITAQGGFDAAGIGGGWLSALKKTVINGGTITAMGGESGAGIGGGWGSPAGEIIINNGKITAKGGGWAAGIGSSNSAKEGGQITINGGQISAQGANDAAGIGGGWASAGGRITINGGSVYAAAGSNSAGIGSGSSGINGGVIVISGGQVTAIGAVNGAGIGGGFEAAGAQVRITGGEITANGAPGGAGIGGGFNGAGGWVEISNAIVNAQGGENGAGIGGGENGYGGYVRLVNSTVTATGGKDGAGIGGGKNGSGAMVQMESGEVHASSMTIGAFAIGGGQGKNDGQLMLSGGVLTMHAPTEPYYSGTLKQTGGEIAETKKNEVTLEGEKTLTADSLVSEGLITTPADEDAKLTAAINANEEANQALLILVSENAQPVSLILNLTAATVRDMEAQGITAIGLRQGEDLLIITKAEALAVLDSQAEDAMLKIVMIPVAEETDYTAQSGLVTKAYSLLNVGGEETEAFPWLMYHNMADATIPDYLWAE